jgi:hypothetical protein
MDNFHRRADDGESRTCKPYEVQVRDDLEAAIGFVS